MTARRRISACAGLALTAAFPSMGLAQQDQNFSLELNNATDIEGACRLTVVAVNHTPAVLEKTDYSVVVFDDQQKVSQILVLGFGKVQVGKTKVMQFDLAGQPCAKISSLLVNDIADCVVAAAPSTVCLDALKASSRVSIGFGI